MPPVSGLILRLGSGAVAAPGSVLLVDFYSKQVVKSLGGLTRATGEATSFGLDLSADPVGAVRSFVGQYGLVVREAQVLGGKTKRGAFGVIAELAASPQE